jgi:hypothetical protein
LGLAALVILATILGAVFLQGSDRAERMRMAESEARLLEIGKAIAVYTHVNGTLPQTASALVSGGPPHSWRTALLPELGTATRGVALNLALPWDSPENLTAAEQAATKPGWFWHMSFDPGPRNGTSFVLVTGPNTVFDGQRARRPREARRGMLKTAIVMEIRDSSIQWHEPRDITIDEAVRELRERPAHPGGAHVLLIDGVVKFLPAKTDEDVIRFLFDQNAPMPMRREEYGKETE